MYLFLEASFTLLKNKINKMKITQKMFLDINVYISLINKLFIIKGFNN